MAFVNREVKGVPLLQTQVLCLLHNARAGAPRKIAFLEHFSIDTKPLLAYFEKDKAKDMTCGILQLGRFL